MSVGRVDLSTAKRSDWSETAESNMGKEAYKEAVAATKEYIQSGDVFQLVLSHRRPLSTLSHRLVALCCCVGLPHRRSAHGTLPRNTHHMTAPSYPCAGLRGAPLRIHSRCIVPSGW